MWDRTRWDRLQSIGLVALIIAAGYLPIASLAYLVLAHLPG